MIGLYEIKVKDDTKGCAGDQWKKYVVPGEDDVIARRSIKLTETEYVDSIKLLAREGTDGI